MVDLVSWIAVQTSPPVVFWDKDQEASPRLVDCRAAVDCRAGLGVYIMASDMDRLPYMLLWIFLLGLPVWSCRAANVRESLSVGALPAGVA